MKKKMMKTIILTSLALLPLIAVAYGDELDYPHEMDESPCVYSVNGTYNNLCGDWHVREYEYCSKKYHDMEHEVDAEQNEVSRLTNELAYCERSITDLYNGATIWNYLVQIRITQAVNQLLINDLVNATKNIDELQNEITNKTTQIKDLQKKNEKLTQDVITRNYC